MVLIHLIHGTQKFDLRLLDGNAEDKERPRETEEGQEPSISASIEEMTLKDLKNEVQKLTNIPPSGQRLILRGKTIFGDSTPLTSLKIREKDKIMVLGSRAEPTEEDQQIDEIKALESTRLGSIQNKLREYSNELEGIEKGFLPAEHEKEALRSLEKKLRVVNEECMRTLEALDGMQLKDGMDRARAKRKDLVKNVQELLDSHDHVQERLRACQCPR